MTSCEDILHQISAIGQSRNMTIMQTNSFMSLRELLLTACLTTFRKDLFTMNLLKIKERDWSPILVTQMEMDGYMWSAHKPPPFCPFINNPYKGLNYKLRYGTIICFSSLQLSLYTVITFTQKMNSLFIWCKGPC
jgi:hypothetical protein